MQWSQETVDTQVASVFERLDHNKDGVVTLEEFISGCQTVSVSTRYTLGLIRNTYVATVCE